MEDKKMDTTEKIFFSIPFIYFVFFMLIVFDRAGVFENIKSYLSKNSISLHHKTEEKQNNNQSGFALTGTWSIVGQNTYLTFENEQITVRQNFGLRKYMVLGPKNYTIIKNDIKNEIIFTTTVSTYGSEWSFKISQDNKTAIVTEFGSRLFSSDDKILTFEAVRTNIQFN